MKPKWESEMKQSHFDKADEVLSNSFSSEQSLNIYSHVRLTNCSYRKNQIPALFDTAKQFEGAKEMILSIETLDSKLSNSVQQWIDAKCESPYRKDQLSQQLHQLSGKLNVFKKETNRQLLNVCSKSLRN